MLSPAFLHVSSRGQPEPPHGAQLRSERLEVSQILSPKAVLPTLGNPRALGSWAGPAGP